MTFAYRAHSALRHLSFLFVFLVQSGQFMHHARAQEASPEAVAAAVASIQSGGNAAEAMQQLQQLKMSDGLSKPGKTAPLSAMPDVKGGSSADYAVPGFASSLPAFGYQLFASGNKYVTPSDLPVPADYVVGVGDMVEIRLFGKENRVDRLPVDRDGTITIPAIGPVSVVGMSLQDMGKMLLERINKQKIGVDATISIGALRSIQIQLLGEVRLPGAVTTDALTTVSNALAYGGGVKASGSLRRVEVRRQGRVIATVDLYDALLKGDAAAGLRLQSGDIVFVPKVGKRVAIGGEVMRPGVYELLKEKTVDDLVSLAGGFRTTAYPQAARMNRVGKSGWNRSDKVVPLATVAQRQLVLQDGDAYDIPGVIETRQPAESDFRFKTVTLEGKFLSAGTYEWQQGMLLGHLVPRFEQIDLSAYRPLAVIERLEPVTGTRQYHAVNLIDVIQNDKPISLERDDRVFIFSHDEIEYLSSVEVQQVLAERLPSKRNPKAKGVIIEADSARAEMQQLLDGSRKSSDIGSLQAQERSEVIGQSNQCRGLIELSNIVANEGTDRFRSALFAGAYEEDGKHLVKSVPCPAVFDKNPRLLPFLLEQAITLRGEVKDPGILPIPPNFTLDKALLARGGLSRVADKNGIEINQLVDDGSHAKVVRVRVASNTTLDKVQIEPGFIIQVRKRGSEQASGLVRLTGEVVHPGNYEIRKGEKFSELLARAGGLTSFAYPYGTVFLRQSIKEEKKQYYQRAALELQNSLLMAMTRARTSTSGSPGEGAAGVVGALVNQMKSIDPIGRMVIEADPAVLAKNPQFDVHLEGGDEIYVPRVPSAIMVMGEVLNPGAVQHESHKMASDYIDAVGGLSRLADEGRIFAILPNGNSEPINTSFWSLNRNSLPPGATIYVSREPFPTTTTDILMLALQVMKDLALSAASLSVISK